MGRKAIHTRPKTIYSNWHNMISRTRRPNSTEYHRYGGRGIGIAEEWLSYNSFYDDMIDTYEAGKTLDRIDVNGDYTKENVRWSTPKQQSRNKRNNRLITHNGETHCLSEWSEITGIKQTTIRQRLDSYGWTIDRALSTRR